MAINCSNSLCLMDLPVADMDPSIRISPCSKAHPKQMMLDVVGSDGQKGLSFISFSERVNTNVYQDLLRQHTVPWVHWMYLDVNYVFQQDLDSWQFLTATI
jgi:hypothetical protein